MICSHCNTEIPDGSSFCPQSGVSLVATSGPAAGAVTEFMSDATRFETRGGGEVLEPGTEFAGRYTIEQRIGAGGMGVVYRAADSVAGRPVALKVINASLLSGAGAVDRLIAEGLQTRDIRHPNVVAVYDVAKAGEQPFVTMEYLDGRSLRSWFGGQLSSGGEVTVRAATGIVLAILDGLQAAHDMGVVHRDLKPENVILLGEPNDGDFRLKLLDFGIARALNALMLQTSAAALGTPLYMAPEQRTSPDAAGPAADIYSISRMLYELLMDVLPDGTWQPPSKHRADVPERIDALLEKGLSNRPRSRQQSVGEYREELLAAVGGAAPDAPPVDPGSVEPKPADPEPVQPAPKPAPAPPRPKPPTGEKRSYKAAFIGFGIVVLLVVGLIVVVALEESGSGSYTPPPDRTNSGGDTYTPPPGGSFSGTWYDSYGLSWNVSVNGSSVFGTGYYANQQVELTGTLVNGALNGQFTVVYDQSYYPVSGFAVGQDLNVWVTDGFGNETPMIFHINHLPH